MSTNLEPEMITALNKIIQDDTVALNEEIFEDFLDDEEISEEDSIYYSGDSVFTQGTIKTYKSEPWEEEIEPEDPLLDVPVEDYQDMFFQMGNDFPQAIHAHEHIRSLIKWKKKCPEKDIRILAPGGDYKNGIFFFSINKGKFYGSAYCHEKTDKSILNSALSSSRFFPVPQNYSLCRITCLNPNTFQAIETIFAGNNWCMSGDVIMWLPWYCARELEVHLPNKNVEIRELNLKHIDLINEFWLENFPGSKDLLGDLVDLHDCLGLFQEECLLSWALLWYHGGIGIIQTVEKDKGKGYCRPVVEALAKRMGKYLIDVHLKITRGRKRDVIFFSKLGFKYAFSAITCEFKKNDGEGKYDMQIKTQKKDQIKS